ncbi:unnamed protein product [Ixodes pacificus]
MWGAVRTSTTAVGETRSRLDYPSAVDWETRPIPLCDDRGLAAASVPLQLGELQGEIHERPQHHLRGDTRNPAMLRGKLAHLRVEFALLWVGFVAVHVEAYRGTAAPRAAQAENNAGPVLEDDTNSLHKEGKRMSGVITCIPVMAYLSLGNAAVHRIGVGEVVRFFHDVRLPAGRELLAHEARARNLLLEGRHHVVGGLALAAFVVVAREKVAAVALPVGFQQLLYPETGVGQHGQPGQAGPDSVFLPKTGKTGAKALLAAQGQLSRVHEVAEVLPASGHLEHGQALLLGHPVHGTGRGHAARQAPDARVPEVGDALQVICQDCQRV